MKVTINIPDEVYSELVIIAERNTRTITQEVLHRVKSFGSSVDTGKGTVHTGSRVSSVKKEVVKPRVVKEKVVEYGSGKKEEIKSVDTGKRGLPSQEIGEFKTFFKK